LDPAAPLVSRRASLLRRLDGPPRALGAVRAAHLAEDLQRMARLRALERWEAEARRLAEVGLRDRLGLRPHAELEAVLDPRYATVLGQIAALPRGFRALARRLVAARAGPPPWDLREMPANRQILARLGGLGLDLGPWLDRDRVTEVETKDLRRVRIGLEP